LVELGRCDINHVDGSGELAFFYAAKGGSVPIVKYMVEHGCNYLHKSLMKRTALTYAKKENKKEVAEYLTLLAK
jgi:ankyrin repeat protein